MDENEQTIVRLGDASIAAPFTSRTSTIQCGRFSLLNWQEKFRPHFHVIYMSMC